DLEASDHFALISDFVLTNFTDYASGFSFPFDEGTGTKVTDRIGGLTGKLAVPAPVWSADSPSGAPMDHSLHFNGAQSISAIDTNQIIGTNGANGDYTLQAWVRLARDVMPPARMVLFQYERRPGFSLSINTNLTLSITAFQKKDIASSAAVPNDGLWHHIAVVHTDGANMKFYIDGVLAQTVAFTGGAGYRTSPVLTIGAASEGTNWFSGFLDRVRFDSRALAASELDYPASDDSGFDAWAAYYGIADPKADADGDGQSNLAEYEANTNPTNAISVFKIISGARDASGNFVLTWASVGGKRYRIEYADGLNGPFIDIPRDAASETDPNPARIPSTRSFVDTNPASNDAKYYRVRIVQ
ncbi:MAG TPA: LamG domain-containing protein, partial [Verrucomicrobiae bacterium]|nr:LamG domain-containing protein [Verrucomicrobiae bacterium]